MSKLPKDKRRVAVSGITSCICGCDIEYVCFRYKSGCANVKTYAVICPRCRLNEYKWRDTIEQAVAAWTESEVRL